MSDPRTATIPNVPHHGGTPAEMLRDLADFLDILDDAGEKLVINAPGHRLDGRTLESVSRLLPPWLRKMQSDVRWLADQLDALASGRNTEAPDGR